jgi:dihydrofolate reductase
VASTTGGTERRPVVIYVASSLDGYLAPLDGSVAWLEPFNGGPDLGFDSFLDTVGSLVTGRTTFEQVRTFGAWPYGSRPTAVLTRGDGPKDLPSGVRIDDGSELRSLVATLQEESGAGTTWLLGGGAVHQSFLAQGMVDEIWTHIMPVLLGDGIPMFPAAYPATDLHLVQSVAHENGVVLVRYRVASADRDEDV